MEDFTVYYEDNQFKNTWVAWNNMAKKYIATPDTKKQAVKKATGEAQQYANRHNTVARVEIYQKNGSYDKTKRVEPTGNKGIV